MNRNDIIKLIAITTMLIDHLSVMFFPEIRVLRYIGRLSFPLFAYLIAIGYNRTSNLNTYRARLLYFAIISQVPFMLFNYHLTLNVLHFNVLFLLLYGTYVIQVFNAYKKNQNELYIVLGVYMILLPVILEYTVNELYLSYSTYGLLIMMLFYYIHDFYKLFISYCILQLLYIYSLGVAYVASYSNVLFGESISYLRSWFYFKDIMKILTTGDYYLKLDGYFIQVWSILALLVIKYSEKLFKIRLHKYVAYIFYPLHMVLLILIRWLVI